MRCLISIKDTVSRSLAKVRKTCSRSSGHSLHPVSNEVAFDCGSQVSVFCRNLSIIGYLSTIGCRLRETAPFSIAQYGNMEVSVRLLRTPNLNYIHVIQPLDPTERRTPPLSGPSVDKRECSGPVYRRMRVFGPVTCDTCMLHDKESLTPSRPHTQLEAPLGRAVLYLR